MISEEIMNKINKELEKSPNYAMRFFYLEAVMKLVAKFGTKFMGSRYKLARQSLNYYGFSKSNKKALKELNEICNQLREQLVGIDLGDLLK